MPPGNIQDGSQDVLNDNCGVVGTDVDIKDIDIHRQAVHNANNFHVQLDGVNKEGGGCEVFNKLWKRIEKLEAKSEEKKQRLQDQKALYDNMIGEREKEISMLNSELTLTIRLKEDSQAKAKEDIERLRSELSEVNSHLEEFKQKAERERAELEAALENQHHILAETRKQEETYKDVIEKQSRDISTLRSDLTDEGRSRRDIEAKSDRERKEFEARFEKQRALIVSMEEQKAIYERHLREKQEELELLRAELLQETHNRKEYQNKAEIECRELKESLTKQAIALDDTLTQNKSYERMVENQKKELNALHLEVSDEKGEVLKLLAMLSEETTRRARAERERNLLENRIEKLSEKFQKDLQELRTNYRNLLEQRFAGFQNELEIQKKENAALGLKLSDEKGSHADFESRLKQAQKDIETPDQRWRGLLCIEKDLIAAIKADTASICQDIFEKTKLAEISVTPRRPNVMIAIMGSSWTGKSSLIRHLTGDAGIKIGHSVIQSGTIKIQSARFFEPDGRCVTLIKIPGFDDFSECRNIEILRKIAAFLEIEFKHGNKLSGIVYLHRISDLRVEGISACNLRMFEKICGSDVLKNAAIVTTRWETIGQTEGESREEELKGNSNFNHLVRAGAQFLRHDGTSVSAFHIMEYFVSKEPIAFQIQHELANGMSLEATAAGAELVEQINKVLKNHRGELEHIRHKLEAAASKSDEMGKKKLELVRENLELMMKKMEKEKDQLADNLESDREQALTNHEFEERRVSFLCSLEAVKRAVNEIRESYRKLARKLEQTVYDRETAHFWERRRPHSGKEFMAKPDTIDPWYDLIQQMIQLGLERPDHNPGHEPFIMVMGQTGVGKSTLVRLLTGDESIQVGHSVESGTTIFTQHCYLQDDGRCVTLIDTPGFDDSRAGEGVTDVAILRQLKDFIVKALNDRKFTGVLYLHRITDNRMGGTHTRIMQMIRKICGSDALRIVAFVTTRWDDIRDEELGLIREQQLVQNSKFLKPFLDGGARMLRHTGSYGSARRIVAQLVDNIPIEIQFQRELATGMQLEDTEVGIAVGEEIRKNMQKHEAEIRKLREEMREAIGHNDLKWKTELEKERDSLMQVIKILKAGEKQLGEGFKSDLARAGLSIDELEQRHH